MKNKSIVADKSLAFALRIVKLYKYLTEQKKEYILAKQILRSGTSIGANIEESLGAQSDADFIAKLSVAYKETRETAYWLKLLVGGEYLTENEAKSITEEVNELARILTSILVTKKQQRRES